MAGETIPIIGNLLSGGLPSLLLIAGIVLLVIGLARAGRSKGVGRAFIWSGVALVAVFGLPLLMPGTNIPILSDISNALGGVLGGLGGSSAGGGAQTGSAGVQTQAAGQSNTAGTSVVTYQPTATYTTVDKYNASTLVTGTSYYKRAGQKATTAAITNVNSGESITYFVDNSTGSSGGVGVAMFGVPLTLTTGASVTPFIANGYASKNITLTLYDTINRQTVGSTAKTGAILAGQYNTSMGATSQANIELTYQGTSKGSYMPLGGVMAVEFNSTISQLVCTGDDIDEFPVTPFHVTYTGTFTANTYKLFQIKPSIDDGSGSPRKISCQFNNGATAAGAGSQYRFGFIPAGYYVANNGDILLDTEKNADGSTTRVISTSSSSSYPVVYVNGTWGT